MSAILRCQAKNRFYESTQRLIQPRRVLWDHAKVSFGFALMVTGTLIAIFVIYWTTWTTAMWRRNYDDVLRAEAAWRRIQELLDEKSELAEFQRRAKYNPCWDKYDYIRVWANWSRATQLGMTLLFGLVASVAVWSQVASCF